MSVLPIVTDIDRRWALDQKPAWARLHNSVSEDFGEIVDDGQWLDAEKGNRVEGPAWFDFVTGEIERFERYFSGQRKTYAEWSSLWRNGWWPKRREDWAFKNKPKEFQPFFRAGSAEFVTALALATAAERQMWSRFGVAQFRPDDPRLAKISGSHEGAPRK